MSADLPANWPTVRVTVPSDDTDWASGELWDAGSTGVAEHPNDDGTVTLVSGFPTEAAAVQAAGGMPGTWAPQVDIVEGADWLDAWREHFPVTRIGRFVLIPAWKDVSRDAVLAGVGVDDLLLELDPGRAFGTGAHPSTALVLRQLPELVGPGRTVLDVGCGSGVLSTAAARLGAASVTAIDVESEAVRVTAQNAARCAVDGVVTASLTPVAMVQGRFDVVLANILAPVLHALAPDIVQRVKPGGFLVLAGLIDTQVDDLLRAYDELEPVCTGSEGIWRCLVLERPI